MSITWIALLAPPVAAGRYTCGCSCIAPVTVLWLAGMAAVLLGLLGEPTGEERPNWYTVGLGLALWAAAWGWTRHALSRPDAGRCGG